MLYQLYESQRALLSPFSEFASATAKLYSHPLSPFTHTPLAHRVSAGLDLMHRLSKEYEKPEFGINSVRVDDVDVAVQEQVIIEKPFCRLLRFKRFTDNPAVLARLKEQPTVLVVAPLSALVSFGLMAGLPWHTWERLIIWMIIGVVLYFAYGYRHSNLRRENGAA